MGKGPGPIRTNAPTCVVVDDNATIRDAVAAQLETAGVQVMGMAGTGVEAIFLLEQHSPAVIIIEFRLSDLSGIDITRLIAETYSDTAVILHTSFVSTSLVPAAIDAGARAIVLKGSSATGLLRAFDVVAAGGTYVDPRIAEREASGGEESA